MKNNETIYAKIVNMTKNNKLRDIDTKRFIEEHSDLIKPDENKWTLLHFAARDGLYDVCKLLLENGADVNVSNKKGMTPLHLAAWNGCPLEIIELLIAHNADVNAETDIGQTPLHWLAYRGNVKVCRFLLEHKADVNAKCPFFDKDKKEYSPLELAIKQKHTSTANLLIEHGTKDSR